MCQIVKNINDCWCPFFTVFEFLLWCCPYCNDCSTPYIQHCGVLQIHLVLLLLNLILSPALCKLLYCSMFSRKQSHYHNLYKQWNYHVGSAWTTEIWGICSSQAYTVCKPYPITSTSTANLLFPGRKVNFTNAFYTIWS